jgi:hypothetical protein
LICRQKNFPDTKATALCARAVVKGLISAEKYARTKKFFAEPAPEKVTTSRLIHHPDY